MLDLIRFISQLLSKRGADRINFDKKTKKKKDSQITPVLTCIHIKGIVHPKMKILSPFSQPYVFPNQFLSSVEKKEKTSSSLFSTAKKAQMMILKTI